MKDLLPIQSILEVLMQDKKYQELIKITQNGCLRKTKMPVKLRKFLGFIKPVINIQWFCFVPSEKNCNSRWCNG